MDLASLIGNIAVWILVLSAMMQGVGIAPYIDSASALIVVFGSLGAVMIAYKMEQVKLLGKLFGVVFKPQIFDYQEILFYIRNRS